MALTLASCGKPASEEGDFSAPAPPESDGAPIVNPEADETDIPAPGGGDIVDLGSVTIAMEAGANRGTPLAVDLVLVYDEPIAAELETLSAAAWFKTKPALIESSGDLLAVMSWRISPGESVAETPIDAPGGAVAAYLFADYAAPGDHRLRISGSGSLNVQLGSSDPSFEIEQ